MVAPKKAATCRSKESKGDWIERSYDYANACNNLKEKSQMKVEEDFEGGREREGDTGME